MALQATDEPMRLRITSDGTSIGTKLIDQDSGQEVENVKSVTWRIQANNLAEARVELIHVPVEVEAEAGTPMSVLTLTNPHGDGWIVRAWKDEATGLISIQSEALR